MRKKLLLAVLPLTLLTTSCATFLTERGIHLDDLVFKESATRADARRVLGPPINSVAFHPAKKPAQTSDVFDKTPEPGVTLSGYEDHRYRGWIYYSYGNGAIVFADLVTAGAAGFINTPSYIHRETHRMHGYRIYYDSRGHYYGHIETEDSLEPGSRPVRYFRRRPVTAATAPPPPMRNLPTALLILP